jgi:predicted DNA-binding protein
MMLTLRIESKTLSLLNTYAKKYSMTRSDFVREIIEKVIDELHNK